MEHPIKYPTTKRIISQLFSVRIHYTNRVKPLQDSMGYFPQNRVSILEVQAFQLFTPNTALTPLSIQFKIKTGSIMKLQIPPNKGDTKDDNS